MKKHNIAQKGKRALSMLLVALMVLSCWVWVDPQSSIASAAEAKDKYLFAYFTDNTSAGQTVHLAVSQDGLNYTALRNNEPVIIPSKGTGAVRDPYLWYNEQDNYYYLIATDMDASGNVWWDNCNGFIMWRSKDLVHWYDETFISVPDLLQDLGKNLGTVHRAWAPQILWDGQSYVVYFSIDTDSKIEPADQLSIVYFKTSNLIKLSEYNEFGGIFYPGSDVNDADIVQHPTTGKWYLFYKPEGDNAKIRMMVSDNATGPYTSPVSDSAGLDIFPGVDEALEGGNGYFDNNGNYVMYADAFGHGTSYFYVSQTSATGDFKTWTVLNNNSHNINSLSPRHGSVVKITTTEYNRLLNNTKSISSSSYSASKVLSDHLIARYFTTSDLTYNAANGKNDLTIYGNMTSSVANGMDQANFDGSDDYAQVKLSTLVSENFNYDDGFTITFTATATSDNNSRFYEIADTFGSRTGTEHYTHFAVAGNNGGAYIGNYGPKTVSDWGGFEVVASKQYNDGKTHKYIVSYANGNTIVYCDGNLIMKTNRFDGSNLDNSWYEAISSDGTMLIGKSGWSDDALLKGSIQDLCIYDCSMSYYDVETLQLRQKTGAPVASTIGSVIPTFTETPESNMAALAGTNFSNVLYSPRVTGMPSGATENSNPTTNNGAAAAGSHDNVYFGVYYANNTVLYVDGINTPKMPVLGAGRVNSYNRDGDLLQIYPIVSTSDASDNKLFSLIGTWKGWNTNSTYYNTWLENPDNVTTGHNSSTLPSSGCNLENSNGTSGSQSQRKLAYIANVLQLNESQVTFNEYGYQKVNLAWHFTVDWQKYSWGWKDWETKNYNLASGFNIWIVDLRPFVDLKNTVVSEYGDIVSNENYCTHAIEAYKAVVEDIAAFNPNSYNYAGGVEAAIKACRAQVDQLKADYNTAKANLQNGHKIITFEAREATCALPGLSEGSSCEYCGKIFEEQKVTEKIPHTFGEPYTKNGKIYVKCSVCGLEIERQVYEVRYENLFSFNAWSGAAESVVHGSGTLDKNLIDGKITIKNNADGEIYTAMNMYKDGSLLNGNWYYIPVDSDSNYYLEFTTTNNLGSSRALVFEYDANGNYLDKTTDTAQTSPTIPTGTTKALKFTTTSNTKYIAVRFDASLPGDVTTYSDIGIYTDETYRLFAAYTQTARQVYFPGDENALITPDCSYGCNFNNWVLDANNPASVVPNTSALTDKSTVVYATWIGEFPGFEVVYDSMFALSGWAASSGNMLYYGDSAGEQLVDWTSRDVTTDAKAGTITIYNDADTTRFAKTNYWVDPDNTYIMHLDPNTEYVFEYTASTTDGGMQTAWLYLSDGTNVTANQTGPQTNYSMGTHYITFNSEDNTELALGFENTENGTTVVFSNIAVYKAESPQADFFDGFNVNGKYDGYAQFDLEAAQNIKERQYMKHYNFNGTDPIGNVFDYTPVRPGYTFVTWVSDTDPTPDGLFDYDCVNLKGAENFQVAQNWHLYSLWNENSYTIKFDANGGSGSIASSTQKYTATVTLPSSGFTKAGYKIIGWSTEAGATTATYQAGQTVNRLNGDKDGSITLYAIWGKNEFTVAFDGNGATGGSTGNQTVGYGVSTKLNTNGFLKTGYKFLGWSETKGGAVKYTDGANIKIDTDLANNALTLYAVWQITDAALVADEVAIDFYRPVAIDPVANDTILKTELNGKDYTLGLVGANERFTVDGKEITYHTTQNEGLTVPTEIVTYTVTFDGITLKSTITVTLASNVYYEESALTTNAEGNLDWEAKGSPRISNVIDAETIDDIYGYNAAYNVAEDFSNGTYLQANVTSSAKKSDTAGFTFTGTGFDLIGACGYNTGVQTVKVQKKVDGAYKTIKLYVVDTYYKGDLIEDGDLLRQTPILTYRGEAGDYKVETTATYLNSATAIKQGTAYFSGTNGAVATTSAKPSKALVNELSSLGFDDTDNIEVVWMDDNSVFNGGTGSVNGSIFGGSAGKYFAEAGTTAGLANYVDGFRIYRDGGADYIESEQNPTYYNIIEGINNKNGTFDPITDNSLTAVFGENFDYNNYLNSNVPKGEIYLAKNQAVAFTFSADFSLGNFADVMLGMRVVKGAVNAKVTAKIDGNPAKTTTPSVISATEMYYDVSDAVQVSGTSGTVTIMVVNTGDGVLAVNNLKLVNGTLEANDSNLELPTGSNTVIGGTVANPTPVAPETETEVEDNTDSGSDSITSMLPGMPASVASFLEMLFKLITQLLSSFGF